MPENLRSAWTSWPSQDHASADQDLGRLHLNKVQHLGMQIDGVSLSGQGDDQGISALVREAPLSKVRLPPPADRLDRDRVMTGELYGPATPQVAMQRASLNGLRAEEPAAGLGLGFRAVLLLC